METTIWGLGFPNCAFVVGGFGDSQARSPEQQHLRRRCAFLRFWFEEKPIR